MSDDYNLEPMYRFFHENIIRNSLGDPAPTDGTLNFETTSFPGAEVVPLEQAEDAPELLTSRRSPNTFVPEPITKSDVETLLTTGVGITSEMDASVPRRAYPSAGARYPLETYVCLLSCDGIAHGLYHFNVLENSLECLIQGNLRDELSFFSTDLVETVSMIVFVTAEFERTMKKYGDFGYLLVMQESGHLMQNLCLIAQHLGLGCRPVAGFVEQDADRFLNRYTEETTIYTGFIGHPA